MAGFGESLGWASNPFYKAFDANRSALVSGFAGLGAADPRNVGGGFATGFAQGMPMDTQRAERAAEEAKVSEQANATKAFLESKGWTDLIPLLDAGQGDTVMQQVSARMQPGYGQAAAPEPFTLGAGETRYGANGEVIAQGTPDQQGQFGNEKDLYAQYAAADPVKIYETVKGGYERVRQSAALQSGAGDMGLIYGYMKMLDPGSVVRESEFAMAAQAGSYGEQIQGLVSRLVNGERLPETVRQQFVQAADGIYSETAANLGDINSQFSTRANNYGVDPSLFVRQPESYSPIQGIVTMPNGNTVKPL